jgi:anti-sigma factor RsiW
MGAETHLTLLEMRGYVRGELHPSTLVALDDHLTDCATCREALARESDASFGAEAFGRALATAEARLESPHLAFDHLRGLVDGTVAEADREWAAVHVALCEMCAAELRDLERFLATLPSRPLPGSKAPRTAAPHARRPGTTPEQTPAPTSAAAADSPRARVLPPRAGPRAQEAGAAPSGYGEQPPARLPFWLTGVAGLSLAALLLAWAC